MPPMYWSTGIQYSAAERSNMPPSNFGEQYRRKYQDDSTKVSIVSVSRRALPPQRGHRAFTNDAASASGEPPLPLSWTSRGSTTGRFSSASGTMPHVSQYRTGMGAPQYRWRLIPQSRRR